MGGGCKETLTRDAVRNESQFLIHPVKPRFITTFKYIVDWLYDQIGI